MNNPKNQSQGTLPGMRTSGPAKTRHAFFGRTETPHSRKAKGAGFTLIEILLALAVFAIGFAMVASVPSGALVLEKRYEQIVEGEIAANNTVAIIGGRRAFWPLYEYGVISSGCTSGFSAWSNITNLGGSDPLQPLEGPYVAGMGSSPLSVNTAQIDLGADADTSASGMLAPLILFPPMEGLSDSALHPSTRCHDADKQGDCEDFFCNPANSFPNRDANTDNGWGSGTQNVYYESDLFKRVFDTNRSSTGQSGNYAGPNPTAPPLTNTASYLFSPTSGSGWPQQHQNDWRWFSDYGDRTDFARAKIHCCHNRLMPALTYPIEIRSYPTTDPVAQRRQFISLGYVDNNLSASKRQWMLQAVAHVRNSSDAWPEGANGLFASNAAGAWPGTGGDPYNQSMMANGTGLFDSRATAPFTIPNYGTHSYNANWTHAHLGAAGFGWPSIIGAVRPLCNNTTQVKQYPSLMRLPAIIYDWDKSQIQVAYPRDYVPGVDKTGPTGLAGDKGSDRRMKVGDHLLTAQGGMVMTVASVQDETRQDYNGITDGVDTKLYYQIITVAPPLSTTPLGGAATNDPAVGNNNAGGNAYPYWRLTHIYIAPPPAGQTLSSWSWATTISGQNFISNNPNQ